MNKITYIGFPTEPSKLFSCLQLIADAFKSPVFLWSKKKIGHDEACTRIWGGVSGYLSSMVAVNLFRDVRFVCDATNNTPNVIDRYIVADLKLKLTASPDILMFGNDVFPAEIRMTWEDGLVLTLITCNE